jgi:hypothetical protein
MSDYEDRAVYTAFPRGDAETPASAWRHFFEAFLVASASLLAGAAVWGGIWMGIRLLG